MKLLPSQNSSSNVIRAVLLPAVSRDPASPDELAPAHFDGTDRRAAISTAALWGVRWSGAFGQALAIRGCVRQGART